ncbi:MAG: ATP-dependent DNA helicase RecG [Lachnospiraceae bacterium]
MNLDSSVKELKGVGDKTKKLLEKAGVYTIRDILLYFPYNYICYPEPVMVGECREEDIYAVLGTVSGVPYRKGGPMQMVTARISDMSASLSAVWFHMPYIKNTLHTGETYVFYGKVRIKNGRKMLEQPAVFHVEDYQKIQSTLQPVYHLSDGLKNNTFKKLVQQSISLVHEIRDLLPEDLRERRSLVPIQEAICQLHFPSDRETLLEARNRLVFEEFFVFLMRLCTSKSQKVKTIYRMYGSDKIRDISNRLPYTLTEGQELALEDILQDMSGDIPMQRLLQGDVGSGKTIIAFLSMLYASQNGYQSCMMAPTEVLAMQHYEKMQEFCEKYAPFTNVYLLVGSLSAAEKKRCKQEIALDSTAIVIGTHALIEDTVFLPDVALVITDEQHRFGVRQRELLAEKGKHPHVLVMSATPIPRTLAVILYGDLDISLIKSLPNNRLPIKNCVVKQNYRLKAYEFIREQVEEGHQAYVICPLVEQSEALDAEDAVSYTAMLQEYFEQVHAGITVACLHGKMKNQQKNEIMAAFSANQIQVLVSTTVIEVGIDVPNATVMMVENAERFGLAQLHQLRGRVGRGKAQSYCIFIDGKNNKEPNKRLEILNTSNDGFYIAEKDLELRGPGDIFGIRQSGGLDFQIADIYQDAELLKEASREVKYILDQDPSFTLPEHTFLKHNINL